MKKIKLGFFGFGNIGTGVYKILQQNGVEFQNREGLDISVGRILVRDKDKPRKLSVDPGMLTVNVEDILGDPDISIIVESMGGVEPARQYILAALEKGKAVVTANKEVIAKCWEELELTARRNKVGLYYEASVAGGIPIIKVLGQSLQANQIQELMGIINGTTNYILTKMSDEGCSFDEALREAQELGFAEPDPTSDVEGLDSMYKLSILSSISFHSRVTLDNIYHEGITAITPEDIEYGRELGYAVRLLAIGKKKGDSIEVRVHPTFIPVTHPLAAVRDSFNAIFIKGDAVGNLMLYGRGAGDLPTGSAMVSDIITACQEKPRYTTFNGDSFQGLDEVQFNPDWETEFFVRLAVADKPGVLAQIAGIFGKYGVSIASVIQKGHSRNGVPLIFVTHNAGEFSMQKAMEDIKGVKDVLRIENLIRVER